MKLAQWIGLLLFAVALYILWEIRQQLLLVFAAVVLANSLNRLAKRLQRAGLKRALSVLIAIGLLLLLIVLFFGIIVPPFAGQLQEMIVLVPEGIDRLNHQMNSLYDSIPAGFKQYVPDLSRLAEQVPPFLNRVLGSSFALFSTSLGAALNFLFVIILALMMLIDPLAYRQGFIRLFPSFYRARVHQILLECEQALGSWIVGALISMGVIALFSLIGLSLIGVKAALANAVLAGLLNFIPNLGPTFSVVPPMAIALLDSPLKALSVLVLYILIQQFESNLLTPIVMAQQVALLPAVTLIMQVLFASFFGFLGLLLAIPLTVVLQIWVRRALIEDVLDKWDTPFRITALADTEIQPEISAAADSETVDSESPVIKDE